MGLSEAVSAFSQAYGNQSSNDEIVEPYAELKNGIIKLGKKIPDFYVRIVPTGDTFYKDYETVSMSVKTRNGDNLMVLQSSTKKDSNDPLQSAVNRWGKRIITPYNRDGKSGRGFTTRFLMNVIPLTFEGNTYKEVVDGQGNYKVYVLSLTWNQFNQILELAKNQANYPSSNQFYNQFAQQYGVTGVDDWGFMSPAIAYPVHMSGSENPKNHIFESNITLQSSNMLAPLANGWKDQLEDLNYQATPAYQYKPKVVSWAIDQMDEALGISSESNSQNVTSSSPQGVPESVNYAAQDTTVPTGVSAPQGGSPSVQDYPSPSDLGFQTVTQNSKAPQANESVVSTADPFAKSNNDLDISDDDLPF